MSEDMLDLEKDEGRESRLKGNSKNELRLLQMIEDWQTDAESGDRSQLEVIWNDEYLMHKGDQWGTSITPSRRKSDVSGQERPKSVDNFIFPGIYNMHAGIFTTPPESIIEDTSGTGADSQTAEELTDLIRFIRYRNKFYHLWKKQGLQWLKHGPFIWMVDWDPDWIGGTGPDRWIGEIKHVSIKKKNFFPDPAIRDLEADLQEGDFHNLRFRKKASWIKKKWPDKAPFVMPDEEYAEDDEGKNANMCTFVVNFHKGTPEYVPDEWKETFLRKAAEYEELGDTYKAQDYRDMAEGTLHGVHRAYKTPDLLLEYVPYVFEDGLYPFVFKVLYEDEEQPLGMGEIRNIMIPQINHNKADEIELEAMAKEGLGGAYYNKGSITDPQMEKIKKNSGKGGAFLEVMDKNGIQDRTGLRVPASITNYKEHKQRMVETITQNTPIQQGFKPGAVTAMGAIQELGARADTKNKGKSEVLEDVLIEITQMEIRRIVQFYTEKRTYRLLGDKLDNLRQQQQLMMQGQQGQQMPQPNSMPNQGMPMQQPVSGPRRTFDPSTLYRDWEREEATDTAPAKIERYIPEFDVRVKLQTEKPTDRNYYTSVALQLTPAGLMDLESLWYTLDEGKFPPKEDIIRRVKEERAMQQQAAMAQNQQGQAPAVDQKQVEQGMMNLKNVMDKMGMNGSEQNTIIEAIKKWDGQKQMAFLSASTTDMAKTFKSLLGN